MNSTSLSRSQFNKRWKEKWILNDIAFHQDNINPLLRQYLPALKLSPGDYILVPLCGKSLDMNWLAQCGLRVVGIELSRIAIQYYFEARGVKPRQQARGRFMSWRHDDIEIWCGDIFDLRLKDMLNIKSLYDCAALTALQPVHRKRYVEHFSKIMPINSQILLMTTETPDPHLPNSAQAIDNEVRALYQSNYHIQLLHGKSCFKTDPEVPMEVERLLEEKVYLMNAPVLLDLSHD